MTDSRLIASSAFVVSMVIGVAILPDAAAQAPGVIVADTFTGANGTPLSSHAPDVRPTGSVWTTTSSAVTLSNQRAATSTRMFATATIDAGTADGTVSADWRSAAWGGSGGIVFRATDANNYWLAYYSDPTCELDKVTNGVARRVTSVDTADDLTQPPMTGHFSVALAGASIRFSCEGYVLQTTDPFNVTGTHHGLQWYGGDGTATFDSFQVTAAPPPTVASIIVTPGPTTVLFKGSQTVSAQAYDAGGALMSGVSVGWSSSNPAAVTVTPLTATTASVSGVGPGTSTITATPVRGASGSATVTVDPGTFLVFDDFTSPNGIALTARPPLLSQIGSAWKTSGGVVTVNTQRAAAAGSAVALIDAGAADGTVSADWSSRAWGGSGGIVFRATDANNYWLAYYGDPTCELDKVINGVARRVTSVEAANDLTQPPMTGHFSVSFTGTSIRFSCEGYVLQTTDAFNVTATCDGVQWYAGDGTATFDNFQVTGSLPPGPSRVAVTPGPTTVLFKGSRTLTAQGFDATDTAMTNVAFTWSSSNPGAVTVTASTSNTAVVSGVGPGSAIVTAAPTRGASGTATVTVDPGTYLVYDDFSAVDGAPLNGRPPLVSQVGGAWITGSGAVTVNGQRATAVGSATALIDAGAADGTVSVDWSSRAWGGIGEIIFRASDAGNLWLAARRDPQCWLGKYVNGHWVTVQSTSIADALNQPPLSDSLSVSLAGANITFTCGGVVLRATDPFNVTATKYGLQWEAGDGTATFDNFSITGTLPPTVASVRVTPGSTAIAFGASTTLTAQAYDAGGSALPNVSVAWATSNPTAIRVTPLTGTTAAISGDATGTATITATPVRGPSGTSTATVTPGPYIVYDRFAGNDGTALTAHGPNVDQIGGGWMVTRAPALALAGGRIGLSNGAADVDAFINAGTPDAAVAVSWRAGENPAGGANYGALIFRRSDARNYFLLESWNGRVALERVMNGTLTTLWSDEADVDPGETHGLQAILSGPSIEVQWDDGVLLRHVTDTFNLSATQYGFRLSPYWDPHATYDDFSVTGMLPPVPDHVAIASGPLTMPFGTSRQLSAQAFDASNAVIPGVAFNWTTSNPMIARVGSISPTLAGVAATGTGMATITATPSRGPSATTAVSVTPGSYIVYDSFTEADGTPLTAHRPEVHAVGNPWTVTGAPAPSIIDGKAARPATGTSDVSVVIDAATPDAAVGISWTAGASPAGGANYGSLIFRQSDARNYFSLEYWSGRVSLYRVVNGRFTRLWSDEANVDPGETHGFSAILAGANIEVLWDNGVLVRSVTDTFNISATQYGFVLSGWDAAATYDSFSVTGTLPPSIPALAASVTTLRLAPFDTREVIAQATDGSGHPVSGAVVQWRSSNSAVATATIDSATTAKVEALAVGTTMLMAHAPIGPAADVTIPVTVSVCVDPPAVSSASFDWLGETKSFVVTAPGTCEWTAWSRAPWIAVVGGASGNGSRTVTYTVDENDSIPRVGTLVIGGRVLTVSQDSQPCTYQMWPESARWGADGGTGGFQVWASSGCPWQAMVTEPAGFLSAMGSGGASGFVTYSLDPNPYAYTRGNTIHIGTAIFTVTQENNSVPGGDLGGGGPPPLPSCAMRFRPNPLEVPLGGGNGQFAVTVDPQCPWTLTPDQPWISVAPVAGIGSGPVAYSVEGSTVPRTGTIRAGNDWLTLNQGFAAGSNADLLEGNDVLRPGEFRTSANGRYRLNYQEDGNLVLYRLDSGRAIWANHEHAVGGAVVMQSDGNFVLYDSAGVPVWSTQTAGHLGAHLQVQDDANVVISSAEGEPLWDTATGMVGDPQPDRLIPGEGLFPGEFRTSPNGAYRLNYQEEDGHFVLYALPAGTALWGNYTYAPDGSIVMQLDGNLVMNDRDGVGVWATWTGGHPGAHLQVQDDGNVVIYGADGIPLWDTGTAQPPPCSVHVAPTAIAVQALGGQAIAPVTVTTGAGCTWTATSDGIWARPTVAASSGDGLETFDVDPNTGAAQRVAHVRIGDTDIVLTQLAAGVGPDVVTYYHTDAIGSVRMTTDAAGHVLARYDYLPFGTIWNAPADPDRREFAGKERDQETGLDYFGARYFSDLSGRFTTVDPGLDVEKSLVDPQRWARYPYVRNNPIRLVDPDGRQVILATPAGYTPADAKRNELWRDWIAQQLSPTPTIARGVDWLASLLWPATAQEQSRSLTLDFVGVAGGFISSGGSEIRVIGQYPRYVELGRELGARVFNVPSQIWERMSESERLAANTKFLDRGIARSEAFVLTTKASEALKSGGYWLRHEINYLLKSGYKIAEDGMSLIPE